ncbi:MAG: hypothetical protein NTW85_07470 [Methylococcales bacterium]|nr:hypothetical protein [Methylococcales bacterium]
MNKKRRLFILSGAVGITGLLTGCLTKSLFKDDRKDDRYEEIVSSVLISEDSKKIVFIGKNHHYIFDAPPIVVKTLTANFHKSVSALLGEFHVDGERIVKGELTLSLSMKAPEQDKLSALEMGYIKGATVDTEHCCEYKVNLTGVRYESNGIQPTLVSQKLNKTYNVYVIAESWQSSGEKAAKVAKKVLLTPITVAIDGLLVIGLGIPLLPFGSHLVLLMGLDCVDNPDCAK